MYLQEQEQIYHSYLADLALFECHLEPYYPTAISNTYSSIMDEFWDWMWHLSQEAAAQNYFESLSTYDNITPDTYYEDNFVDASSNEAWAGIEDYHSWESFWIPSAV